MAPPAFHPVVAGWFERRFGQPTEPQALAWPEIARRRHTLIAAPTGSGKTLAAFLAAIDALLREGLRFGELPDETRVVYVSPLKALSNDVRRNLEEPLAAIRAAASEAGLGDVEIRTQVRTGDTPASERAAMTRRPPHLLVTTPESLYILLTSDGGRRMLERAETVIVDEIHAVAGNKRGSHLALSLERLEQLTRARGGRLLRVGLSATQRPIEEVARFLLGTRGRPSGGPPDCSIVDVGHRREIDLSIAVPRSPLEAVMSGEVWGEVYDLLAERIRASRTTLIFVNTRRLAERVTRHLGERLGPERVGSHHGSLSKEQRLAAERRLKNGELSALVATASLELGIDVGSVDQVCIVGSPRSITALLQRVGRSGHHLAARPRGFVFPTTRDELVECGALLDAVRRGELEQLEIPDKPLDVLAQQIVAEVSAGERGEEELFEIVRRAHPYRGLERREFDELVEILAHGFATHRGRRGALLHHDAVHRRLRPRRGARLAAITSGGAIPDTADYTVVLEPSGTVIGTLNEDFAIESAAGDIFQLGNSSWRIRRVEQGRVLVEDAQGAPPTIPFWLGEAPARSAELSAAVSRLREEIDRRAGQKPASLEPAVEWLAAEVGTGRAAAEQLVEYAVAAREALGAMPTAGRPVLERFFDEAGNQHVVLHSPRGGRVNRAWGLALRKRFCRTFNFELQAAATEDALVLSLGPTHSFVAEDVFAFLHSSSVRDVLTQALLDAPMFTVRWRWNANRSLAVLRFRGGRRVPAPLQRVQAEDLISVVFPDQLACLENISGEREVPDHPLVRQTVRDCLEEAMDVASLERLLAGIETGTIRPVVREMREPSPLAHEVLNARPYAFLDDAPLEERRTQAVIARRWLDPSTAAELGRFDRGAIARVRAEAWPEVSSADELHDALVCLGFLTREEGKRGAPAVLLAEPHGPSRVGGWESLFDELVSAGRAARARVGDPAVELWVAAERLPELEALFPGTALDPPIRPPERLAEKAWSFEEAAAEILRGRLGALGPVTAGELSGSSGLDAGAIESALAALEAQGFAMRGSFTPGAVGVVEWCERGLLARIHRRTVDRLRAEIRPVSRQDFMRFLLAWQHILPDDRVHGGEALAGLLGQLEGFEAPAAAWEAELLPARIEEYDPIWLDAACLSGRYLWGRISSGDRNAGRRATPLRTTPIAILGRECFAPWSRSEARPPSELSAGGREILRRLEERGASFFGDLVAASGLLRARVEQALAELVAHGLASSDSFTGLRALLAPPGLRPTSAPRRGRRRAVFGMEHAGRWSLLERATHEGDEGDEAAELIARSLLRRYGVVFRGLLDRESLLPPWRELLRVLRRLEARGEIRGGRFVDGFTGDQFALPEAVGRLRAVRREERTGGLVSISAADPLNLVGSVLPGERVAALTANRILFRDGLPVAVYESREVRYLEPVTPAEQWRLRSALLRRRVPPQLRAYLGRPA